MRLQVSEVLQGCEPLEEPPQGFMTVPQFWREYESEALDLLENPALTFFHDAEELQSVCERRGIVFHYVRSGEGMAAIGLHETRAFPVEVLHEFYPASP